MIIRVIAISCGYWLQHINKQWLFPVTPRDFYIEYRVPLVTEKNTIKIRCTHFIHIFEKGEIRTNEKQKIRKFNAQ